MTKNRILLIVFLGLIIYFVFKIFSENNPYANTPTLVNKDSSCIHCHTEMQGFSPAHAPDKITCTACHLGNNNAFTKKDAHKKMVSVAGNLSNASETCAKCHAGIDVRINNSMMNTMSGIVSVDKYVFGENDNLDSLFNIHQLQNISSADNHLRNKCASCHIGNEKIDPHPITEKSRGGGCTACHLNYSTAAKNAHEEYIFSKKTELPKVHPSLSLSITDNHCFGCHSRSGRISTNYEGWHETILKPDEVKSVNEYRVLEDGRVFQKEFADVHHTLGMSCVDCHDATDVMGDGIQYAHQEEAVNLDCQDCHFSGKIKTVSFFELEEDEKRIVRLKNIDTTHQFLHSSFSNKNMLNVILENNQLILLAKNSKREFAISPPSENCGRAVHKNIKCSTCHTSWAPQCIGCHTSFDAEEEGFDLLTKEWVAGKWIEKGSDYRAEFPTLGVVWKNNEKEIKTFSPGMIMSLEKNEKEVAGSFHRLFAPISAHTISAEGKTCTTCHNNPVALGYGRGVLAFLENGTWSFQPTYPKGEDGLPQDAWIPFLQNDTIQKATRTNARPFTLAEQQKILRVGACLSCHKKNTKLVNEMLSDFDGLLEQCTIYNEQ